MYSVRSSVQQILKIILEINTKNKVHVVDWHSTQADIALRGQQLSAIDEITYTQNKSVRWKSCGKKNSSNILQRKKIVLTSNKIKFILSSFFFDISMLGLVYTSLNVPVLNKYSQDTSNPQFITGSEVLSWEKL